METRTRTRGSTAIQDEDFQPKSEWKEEEGANVLLVYLPGFQKEQIKVTYVHSSHTVRVHGERPITSNKWSRFNQTFPIPKNCEENKIKAKFQHDEVLIITMPKAVITQAGPKEEAQAIQEAPMPPKDTSTSIGKEEKDKVMTPQIPQKAAIDPKAQKSVEEDTASFASQKQTNGNKVEALGSQEGSKEPKSKKVEDDVPPNVASFIDTTKQNNGKSTVPGAKIVDQKTIATKEKREANEKALFEQGEDSSKKRKESMISENEESSRKRKESMMTNESDPSKTLEKKKEHEKRDGLVHAGERNRKEKFIAEKMEEVKNVAADAKKTMQQFAMDLSGDKQSMVNMGVAVLVIAALGAYIYYKYGSSRNASH